jgi:hypothetical protein
MKTAKSVAACCIVKSSANIKEIDDNTLRVLVHQFFETSELDLRKAIYLELQEAIFNSKDPDYLRKLKEARDASQVQLKEWSAAWSITYGHTAA